MAAKDRMMNALTPASSYGALEAARIFPVDIEARFAERVACQYAPVGYGLADDR